MATNINKGAKSTASKLRCTVPDDAKLSTQVLCVLLRIICHEIEKYGVVVAYTVCVDIITQYK